MGMKEESKLMKITRKWWFYFLLFMAQCFALPYAERGFSFEGIGELIGYTLGHSLQGDMREYYLFFQLLAIGMFVGLIVWKNRFARVFNIYVFISYLLFTVLQNVAFTEKYGWSIVSINAFMFLFVAAVWLMEVIKPRNDYSFAKVGWRDSWLIALSIFAFWLPLENGDFDFNPLHFFDSGSSLAFCMMTPVFLTIMTLNLPQVNPVTYRITALIGVVIGLYNMMNFQELRTLNLGIVHLPLMIISIYSFYKSFKVKNYGEKAE